MKLQLTTGTHVVVWTTWEREAKKEWGGRSHNLGFITMESCEKESFSPRFMVKTRWLGALLLRRNDASSVFKRKGGDVLTWNVCAVVKFPKKLHSMICLLHRK